MISHDVFDGPSGPVQKLRGVSFLQQKIVSSDGFVGTAYDEDKISVLPDESTTGPVGEAIKSMKAVNSVTVEVPSMIRRSTSSSDNSSELEVATDRIIRDFNGEGEIERYVHTLPNDITLSFPVVIDDHVSSRHLYFALQGDDGSVQVVDVVFEREGFTPLTATSYEFNSSMN